MKIKVVFLIFFIISSGIFYYVLTEPELGKFIVFRVIDGDSLELENGMNVRFLGINTPEKNQFYYSEAKDFLSNLIEGKVINLEWKDSDRYGRILGYVFFEGNLVNENILEEGLAHLYYYETDEYFGDMEKAELMARESEKGIWKKSDDYGCIELIKLQYEEPDGRCINQEQLILNNKCETMQITIKDDATHIYKETIKPGKFVKNFSCIWNDDGDSLYIWDSDGLILFYRYS